MGISVSTCETTALLNLPLKRNLPVCLVPQEAVIKAEKHSGLGR